MSARSKKGSGRGAPAAVEVPALPDHIAPLEPLDLWTSEDPLRPPEEDLHARLEEVLLHRSGESINPRSRGEQGKREEYENGGEEDGENEGRTEDGYVSDGNRHRRASSRPAAAGVRWVPAAVFTGSAPEDDADINEETNGKNDAAAAGLSSSRRGTTPASTGRAGSAKGSSRTPRTGRSDASAKKGGKKDPSVPDHPECCVVRDRAPNLSIVRDGGAESRLSNPERVRLARRDLGGSFSTAGMDRTVHRALAAAFCAVAERRDDVPDGTYLWELITAAEDLAQPRPHPAAVLAEGSNPTGGEEDIPDGLALALSVPGPAVPPRASPSGRYAVRVFSRGTWRRVSINDALPKCASSGDPLVPRLDGAASDEAWPALLGKAVLAATMPSAGDGEEVVDLASLTERFVHALTGWHAEVCTDAVRQIGPESPADALWRAVIEANAFASAGIPIRRSGEPPLEPSPKDMKNTSGSVALYAPPPPVTLGGGGDNDQTADGLDDDDGAGSLGGGRNADPNVSDGDNDDDGNARLSDADDHLSSRSKTGNTTTTTTTTVPGAEDIAFGIPHTVRELIVLASGERLLRVACPIGAWKGRYSDSDASSWGAEFEDEVGVEREDRLAGEHGAPPGDFYISCVDAAALFAGIVTAVDHTAAQFRDTLGSTWSDLNKRYIDPDPWALAVVATHPTYIDLLVEAHPARGPRRLDDGGESSPSPSPSLPGGDLELVVSPTRWDDVTPRPARLSLAGGPLIRARVAVPAGTETLLLSLRSARGYTVTACSPSLRRPALPSSLASSLLASSANVSVDANAAAKKNLASVRQVAAWSDAVEIDRARRLGWTGGEATDTRGDKSKGKSSSSGKDAAGKKSGGAGGGKSSSSSSGKGGKSGSGKDTSGGKRSGGGKDTAAADPAAEAEARRQEIESQREESSEAARQHAEALEESLAAHEQEAAELYAAAAARLPRDQDGDGVADSEATAVWYLAHHPALAEAEARAVAEMRAEIDLARRTVDAERGVVYAAVNPDTALLGPVPAVLSAAVGVSTWSAHGVTPFAHATAGSTGGGAGGDHPDADVAAGSSGGAKRTAPIEWVTLCRYKITAPDAFVLTAIAEIDEHAASRNAWLAVIDNATGERVLGPRGVSAPLSVRGLHLPAATTDGYTLMLNCLGRASRTGKAHWKIDTRTCRAASSPDIGGVNGGEEIVAISADGTVAVSALNLDGAEGDGDGDGDGDHDGDNASASQAPSSRPLTAPADPSGPWIEPTFTADPEEEPPLVVHADPVALERLASAADPYDMRAVPLIDHAIHCPEGALISVALVVEDTLTTAEPEQNLGDADAIAAGNEKGGKSSARGGKPNSARGGKGGGGGGGGASSSASRSKSGAAGDQADANDTGARERADPSLVEDLDPPSAPPRVFLHAEVVRVRDPTPSTVSSSDPTDGQKSPDIGNDDDNDINNGVGNDTTTVVLAESRGLGACTIDAMRLDPCESRPHENSTDDHPTRGGGGGSKGSSKKKPSGKDAAAASHASSGEPPSRTRLRCFVDFDAWRRAGLNVPRSPEFASLRVTAYVSYAPGSAVSVHADDTVARLVSALTAEWDAAYDKGGDRAQAAREAREAYLERVAGADGGNALASAAPMSSRGDPKDKRGGKSSSGGKAPSKKSGGGKDKRGAELDHTRRTFDRDEEPPVTPADPVIVPALATLRHTVAANTDAGANDNDGGDTDRRSENHPRSQEGSGHRVTEATAALVSQLGQWRSDRHERSEELWALREKACERIAAEFEAEKARIIEEHSAAAAEAAERERIALGLPPPGSKGSSSKKGRK